MVRRSAILALATAFARSYGTPSMPWPVARARGLARDAVPDGTSFPDFSLIYVVRRDEVEVVAVAHGKRRPGYWRPRL
jgi:hypothetical protein